MKNKSWQYPFVTLYDKYFDTNKDGKLDSFETFFRDMYINEMNQRAEEYRKTKRSEPWYSAYYDNYTNTNDTNKSNNKSAKNNTPAGVQLFVILLVMVILIGSFIFVFSTEGTAFIQAVIMLAAVSISISLLKFVGLYK